MKKLLHRGDSKNELENTIEAIKSSLVNKNFDGLEIDIKLTKDNKWIIFHDNNLKRLSKINKKISNVRYENLPKLNYNKKKYKIPLLKDLTKLNFKNKILNIEIKNKFNIDNNFKNQLLNIINNINANIIMSSFNWKWNKWCKKYNLEFGYLIEKKIPNLNNKDLFIFDIKLLSKSNIINKINKIKNIKIGAYTLNKNLKFNNKIKLKIEIWDN